MKRINHKRAALLTGGLWLVAIGTMIADRQAAPPTEAGATERTPLYIPAPAFGAEVACGGDTTLVRLSYLPKPDEGAFVARFRAANYGPEPGYAAMAVGDAYEEGVTIPPYGGLDWYTITVRVPTPVAWAPIILYAGSTARPSVCADDTKRGGDVIIKDLNIFAQP